MTIHHVIKILTGFLIVPLSVFAFTYWPKWEKLPLPVRIITGIVFLPLVGIAHVTSGWWGEF